MIVHFQWQQLMKLPNPQITQRCFAIGTADKSGFAKIKGKQTIKQLKKKKRFDCFIMFMCHMPPHYRGLRNQLYF